jgi:hypothetical protein
MHPVSLVGFLCSLGLTFAQGEVKGHAFNKVLEVWLENQVCQFNVAVVLLQGVYVLITVASLPTIRA